MGMTGAGRRVTRMGDSLVIASPPGEIPVTVGRTVQVGNREEQIPPAPQNGGAGGRERRSKDSNF